MEGVVLVRKLVSKVVANCALSNADKPLKDLDLNRTSQRYIRC